MKCSEDATLHKRFVEKKRTYDFLASLNMEFEAIRVQILGKEDIPSLNEVISLIRAEEGRRGVMLDTAPIEKSALIALRGPNRGPKEERKAAGDKTSNNRDSRDSLWYTFCKNLQETKAYHREMIEVTWKTI